MSEKTAKRPSFSPDYCTFMFWAQTVAGIILVGGISALIGMDEMPTRAGMVTLAVVFVWTIMGLAVWLAEAERK